MLSDEDRAWLKKLDEELWLPRDNRSIIQRRLEEAFPGSRKKPPPPEPRGPLTHEEIKRVFTLIEETPLLTTLFPHGMICGVGLKLWEHELFPGTGPEPLLSLTEEKLPDLNARSWYEHLLDVPKAGRRKRAAGDCDPDAWDIFTKFTHSDRNRAWIAHYGIEMHFDKVHYDY